LVKKPSKKNFPLPYPRLTPGYDYAAAGTADKQFGAGA
jgi:hypothetical protein